jgi:hypothetical protein
MAKSKEPEKLKSELADTSDISALEEMPNTEFFIEPAVLAYHIYKGEEDRIRSIVRVEEDSYTSFPMDENNNDYKRYLAWVSQGNVAEEIAL